jgi:hypothetical protein
MDPHSSHREIAHNRELYRAGLAAADWSIAGREIPIARFVAIASTARRKKSRGAARDGSSALMCIHMMPMYRS